MMAADAREMDAPSFVSNRGRHRSVVVFVKLYLGAVDRLKLGVCASDGTRHLDSLLVSTVLVPWPKLYLQPCLKPPMGNTCLVAQG